MSATEEREIASKSLDLREKSRYDASVRLSVAPMMDWTDRHCRVFHRLLAPTALLYTEMVHANAVLEGDRERCWALMRSSIQSRCSWAAANLSGWRGHARGRGVRL